MPAGFAHGYLSLEDDTIFAYKVDNYYSKEHEKSIGFQDPSLNISWPIPTTEFIVSKKDQNSPYLGEHAPYE